MHNNVQILRRDDQLKLQLAAAAADDDDGTM